MSCNNPDIDYFMSFVKCQTISATPILCLYLVYSLPLANIRKLVYLHPQFIPILFNLLNSVVFINSYINNGKSLLYISSKFKFRPTVKCYYRLLYNKFDVITKLNRYK